MIKWIFCFAIFLQPLQVGFAQKTAMIPTQVINILDSEYAGWKLVNNMSIVNEPVLSHLNLDTNICHPNFVWGDFDGNKKRDYALFIERTNELQQRVQYLLAFLNQGKTFKKYLIRSAIYPAYVAEYIWIAKKGTPYFDYGKDRKSKLVQDGIQSRIIEKSAATYIFRNGRFQGITTED